MTVNCRKSHEKEIVLSQGCHPSTWLSYLPLGSVVNMLIHTQVFSLSNFSRGLRAIASPSCYAVALIIAQCVCSLAIHLHSPSVR